MKQFGVQQPFTHPVQALPPASSQIRGQIQTVFGSLERWLRGETILAPELESKRKGDLGHHAVLVIDASPSMLYDDWRPTRLKAAQEAAIAYVERLSRDAPDAFVGIVSYHSEAEIKCRLISVSNRRKILRAINSITTSSCTNITAGVDAAIRMLRKQHGNNQVVLLTDGDHNTGPNPRRSAKRLRAVATVETIGIGGSPSDVNESLLRDIASAHGDGSKRYRFIGDEEKLVEHFQSLAGYLSKQ